jgi:AcrR family transcriptional regulator
MSPRPRRAERHPDLQTAIKETAWKQIAALGAPALNLRAIARDLNITAPSIYNYFSDRDALVTALIVDAFTSFADAQADTLISFPPGDHAARLRALGLAYRRWAIAYPERYQLAFGTPIAGYAAPAEITGPAAACGLSILVSVLVGANSAGRLRVATTVPMPPEVQSMLRAWQTGFAPETSLEVLNLALIIWGQVHGLVSIEIGNQFPVFITDAGAVYQLEIERIIQRFIIPAA